MLCTTFHSSPVSAYYREMSDEDLTRRAIEKLLAAVESRDLRKVERALHPDAVWQNVPHAPAEGRESVMQMLASIICWSNRVQWDVLSASVRGDTGWYERLDRFWIDGAEYAVPCNGVFRVDPVTRTVCALRDYVDLGEWRSSVAPVMTRLTNRFPAEVVAHHLEAVKGADPISMAADYAYDASLQRGDERYDGWAAIADYFDTVPARLTESATAFGPIETVCADQARVGWHISAMGMAPVTGVDTFMVSMGRITHQLTELHR